MTKEERVTLKRWLGMDATVVALANVALERSQIASDLIKTDLSEHSSDRVMYLTARAQGVALGIQKALGMLFDLSEVEEEEDDEDADE
jgi:hypothetical protein